MANVLNGWLGYGSAMAAGTLVEPVDINYARRPVVFGPMDQKTLVDMAPGTVGPASTSWGMIGFIGIFDASSGGNLLLWLPTSSPMQIKPGASISAAAGSLRMVVSELVLSGVRAWPTGAVIATTIDGRSVSVGVPLQLAGGVIVAQTPSFGMTVLMSGLPQAQPAPGTGQVWNNGGVISVA